MKSLTLKLSAASIALAAHGLANAAKISTIKLDEGGTAIVVTGDIESGDGAKFRSEASKYDEGFVLLESDGGSLADAIDMGETIRLKGYATAVINGSSCNSACALIWLAGTPRALSRSGRVGFHAAYTDKSGAAQESGVANAMVGRYLTLLNLPEKALIFATSSPPSRLNWLTSSNYASTGIEAKIIEDLDLSETKAQASTPGAASPPTIMTVTTPTIPETEKWRDVDPWLVEVDHTLDNGCFIVASFERNTVLGVGVNRSTQNQYYILFGNPDWKSLKAGDKYDVQFQFDKNGPWNVPATGVDMGGTTFLRSNFTDASFWNEFTKSYSLDITRNGKQVTKLTMSGTKAAFEELISCQKYQDAKTRSRDPFAE